MVSKKQKDSIGERLISNTTYLFLDWFALAFFSFFFWAILGKTLNPYELGIVSTSINFVILVTWVSTLGITNALQKMIPEIRKSRGIKNVYSLIKNSSKLLSVSLFLLFIIFSLLSYRLPIFLKIPNYVFLIIIFSIIIFPLYNFLGSILYGLQNMKLLFITDSFQIIIRIILTAVLIFIGLSFFAPLIAFSLGYFFIIFFRFKSEYFTEKTKFSYKKLFFYSFPALVSNIANALTTNGQYIILTVLKNFEITGIFTISFTITSIIGVIMYTMNSALFPIISSLSIDKKTRKKQGYLIGLVLRYGLFLIIPASLLLVLFSRYAILLFSKPEFLPSTQYFPILVTAAIFLGIGNVFLPNLYAIGKPIQHRNITIVSSLCFLATSIILTNYFSALGLSFSFLIAMFLRFLLSFICMRKYLKINFFIKDVFKISLSSLIIALVTIFLRTFVHDIFLLSLILPFIGIFYLVILLFMKFYRKEDIRILKYFAKRIPILRKIILSISDFTENKGLKK